MVLAAKGCCWLGFAGAWLLLCLPLLLLQAAAPAARLALWAAAACCRLAAAGALLAKNDNLCFL
jgi:hypothetical protein